MRIGICEFRKSVNFKNGYLAEVKLPLDKMPIVQITDISKDWQQPLDGTKDIGNPKLKGMSKKDFRKTFKVTHIKTIVGYDIKKYKRKLFLNKCLLILMKWLRLA